MNNADPSTANQAPAPVASETAVSRRPSFPSGESSRLSWVFRSIVLVVVIGSAVLALYCLMLLLPPLQRESRELGSRVSRLSTEVDNLDRQWPKAKQEQVSREFNQVNSNLFNGRAAVEEWLADFKTQAATLALDAHAELGAPTEQSVGGHALTVVPAKITLEVLPAVPDMKPSSPYQRIQSLNQGLASQRKFAALTALTVEGGDSISRAVLELNFWVRKEEPR